MPAIIVHSLDHAVAALKSYRDAATDGFVLSPRGAAATMGAAVFNAIIAEAQKQVPDVQVTAVLDCGSDPGYALAAVRAGTKAIVFQGNDEATLRITDIAKQNACQIFDTSVYTDSEPLDLINMQDALEACRAYLAL
jgi:hypothetical protein